MSYYLAVDVGGTQLRAACYPPDSLKPCRIARTTTQAPDLSTTPLERLQELIASIWPSEPVTAISVVAPGPIDPYAGVVREAPNIPGWIDLPLREVLQDRFNVPVVIGNDANLAALGEWMFGAGKGHHHLIYLTVSTGIGAGVIIDDRLLLGAHGLAAELGHVIVLPEGPLCGCGARGHLEALASGPAIARWVKEQLSLGAVSSLLAGKSITAKLVAQAAAQGDELGLQALERAGTFIGMALADFLHIFNPTIVILGGGVSRSGDLLLEPIRKAMKVHVMNPHYLDNLVLTTAMFEDEVGLIGALALGRMSYPQPTHITP